MSEKGNLTKAKQDDEVIKLQENLIVCLNHPLPMNPIDPLAASQQTALFRIVRRGHVLGEFNDAIISNIRNLKKQNPDLFVFYGRSFRDVFTKDEIVCYINNVAPLVKLLGKTDQQLFNLHEGVDIGDITDINGILKWKGITAGGKKIDTAGLNNVIGDYYDYLKTKKKKAERLLKDISVFEKMLAIQNEK